MRTVIVGIVCCALGYLAAFTIYVQEPDPWTFVDHEGKPLIGHPNCLTREDLGIEDPPCLRQADGSCYKPLSNRAGE